MFSSISYLFQIFDKRTRLQFFFLFVLMLVCAVLETGGIGLIVPLISIILKPELIHENKWLSWINEALHIESTTQFLIYMCIFLMGFYFIKNFSIGLQNYLQTRFVFSKRSALGQQVFILYLKSPYTFHLERNTSELFRNIQFETPGVYGYVQSMLIICTEACVLISILAMLLAINPLLVLISFGLLGTVSGIFYKMVSKTVRRYGEKVQSSQTHINQAMLEGFGSIKEVKISRKEAFFPNRYYSNMMENARANWMNVTLSTAPRLFMEVIAVGGIIVAILVLLQLQKQEMETLVPTLSLLAVATIRLLPSFTKIVAGFQRIRFCSPSVEVVAKEISTLTPLVSSASTTSIPVAAPQKINFQTLKLQNLGFHYPNSKKHALKQVSLTITKGQAVAFVGSSGAGKTTLINIVLGLLSPSDGSIHADNQDIFKNLDAWQSNIGYVPQAIYLLDASIRENIAFGIDPESIDDSKVWNALKVAQLEQFTQDLPEGLNTHVGENGVRLSGGQRQRLGIARALYHDPEVLILDEATSALDTETEKEVSREIEELSGQKTLLIVAHRLSTIKKCDVIYFMESGTVTDSGTFDELLSNNASFKQMASLDAEANSIQQVIPHER